MESAKKSAPSARTLAVPVKDLPGSLPTISVPEDDELIETAEACLEKLQKLTAKDLCTDVEAFWRDILILTASFRTFCGSDRIVAAWNERIQSQKAANFQLVPYSARLVRAGRTSWVQAAFSFECAKPSLRSGSGFLKAIPDEGGNWNIWNTSTMLERIPEFGDVDFLHPSADIPSSVNNKNGYMDTR